MPRFNKKFQGHQYIKAVYVHFIFYLTNAIILFLIFNVKGIYCHLINLFLLGAGVVFSKRLRIIGLTGQVCSGKSTTAKYLREKHGASVIIVDDINKEVLSRPYVLKEIRDKFGDEVFFENGDLNKLKMREIIFKDLKKRKELEYITHFRVLLTMVWMIIKEKFLLGNKYVILENALLLRFSFLTYWCFPILSICMGNDHEIIMRIMERDRCPQEIAENMLKNQFTSQEFFKLSYHCILNESNLENLFREIDNLLC